MPLLPENILSICACVYVCVYVFMCIMHQGASIGISKRSCAHVFMWALHKHLIRSIDMHVSMDVSMYVKTNT
jgi:hypothetical protein